jgi:phosphopantetheinyl transferase
VVEASERTPGAVTNSFEGDDACPDVWLFDRASEAFLALADAGPVTAEARAKADRLRAPGMAAFMLARRAATRRVLGCYLGREGASVRVVTLPGGKPTQVPERGDRWSLAYSAADSQDLFCLAIGTARSLGVDVERVRDVPRALPIAMRWFSGEESAFLRSVPADAFSGEFLRLWTAKEALAKRHSAGLRLMKGDDDGLDVHWEAAKGHLVHFEPRASYVACLASPVPISRIRLVTEACAAL